MKTCTKCHKSKPTEEFYRHANMKDGRRPNCKACTFVPATFPQPEQRFREFTSKRNSGCWEWTGSTRTNNGYGRFWAGDRHVVAHRYAWEQKCGEIPHGLEV